MNTRSASGAIAKAVSGAAAFSTSWAKPKTRPEEVASLVAFAIGPHGALRNGSVALADDGATGGCV